MVVNTMPRDDEATSMGCLQIALDAEDMARRCRIGDPYRGVALRDAQWWLNEAARLEREGK